MGDSKFVLGGVSFRLSVQWVRRGALFVWGIKNFVCRWSPHSSADVGIHCRVRHNPLHCGRAAPADPGSCRADGAHVHIHVQLRQGQARPRTESVPGLDRLVGHPCCADREFYFRLVGYNYGIVSIGSFFGVMYVCRVCVWTAILLFLLAILGACSIINRFTRIAGELFGLLIAMLFMQQAIKVGENYSRPFQAVAAFQAWNPVLMQKLFVKACCCWTIELYTKHQLPCLSKSCSTPVNLNATNQWRI